jgi:hypothetical protein
MAGRNAGIPLRRTSPILRNIETITSAAWISPGLFSIRRDLEPS